MRIASLLPASTEMVCALGARDELVGISHECDHPVGLGARRLTRARKLGTTLDEIDKSVRSASSIYDLDLDALAAARPDVVITQDLCSVCAVSLDEVTAALRALARTDAEIVSLQPTTLSDVFDDIARVGRAIERRSTAVISTLRARIEAIAARAANTRAQVLTIEWIDPVMVGGLWMPELIELAGGTPLVTKRGEHAPTLTRQALSVLAPASSAATGGWPPASRQRSTSAPAPA